MVEIHYEEERGLGGTADQTEIVHWRVIVNDEAAALAQVAQDLADGRQPLAIVERPAAADPWDYTLPYDRRKWRTLLSGQQMHSRARTVGAAF